MALYTFYDTDGEELPFQENTNTNSELASLWGNINAVNWFKITPQQLLGLQNYDMLEITLHNLIPLSGMGFTHVFRNFTIAENNQRISSLGSINRVSIAKKILKEGNNAKFRFRIHKNSVLNYTQNFTIDLEFTICVLKNKISFFIKPQLNNQIFFAFGVTLASGGVKIPR